MKEPTWHVLNLTSELGVQWRWARGDASWGLKLRTWRPGTYAGMPGGIRYRDHYWPLWPAKVDYQMIAQRAGWVHGGDAGGFIYHGPTWGSWKAAASWAGDPENEPNGEFDHPDIYNTWRECCELEGLIDAD